MKKSIVSFIVACMTLSSGVALAQTTNESNAAQNCCPTEKSDVKGKGKKDKKERKGNKAGKEAKAFNPFDGIQLTDDQQQRLQVLREGLGPVIIPGDSLQKMNPEQMKQARQDMASKRAESKRNYLNGVKEILEPEQYVIFLENVYINGGDLNNAPGKHHKDKDKLGKKDMKRPGNSPKPQVR